MRLEVGGQGGARGPPTASPCTSEHPYSSLHVLKWIYNAELRLYFCTSTGRSPVTTRARVVVQETVLAAAVRSTGSQFPLDLLMLSKKSYGAVK